ncbi:UNKNOWN [Stylonychia lemnae]|uniref:Uncharacterized protein n=1 Tax=Stylonychia lemnae TaxID=5949 RepID=A0A077ZPZ1_STYLE|nr:UNKNOWN [Stylonychia lemnae]|eukprot:CDW71450.1 UNKNOWN [Stylonychia lemnae]
MENIQDQIKELAKDILIIFKISPEFTDQLNQPIDKILLISEKFARLDMQIDLVKSEELLKFIDTMQKKLEFKFLLGKKKHKTIIIPEEMQVKYLSSWLNQNLDYFQKNSLRIQKQLISRNILLATNVNRYQNGIENKNHLYGSKQELQGSPNQNRSLENSLESLRIDQPPRHLVKQNNRVELKKFNENNLLEQDRQKEAFNRPNYNSYTSPKRLIKESLSYLDTDVKQEQDNQQDQDVANLMNKTFYTQGDDNDDSPKNGHDKDKNEENYQIRQSQVNNSNYIKLPSIKQSKLMLTKNTSTINPYQDDSGQNYTTLDQRNRSLDQRNSQESYGLNLNFNSYNPLVHSHQRVISSSVIHSLDYNRLKKDISTLFDVMEHDKSSFKEFQQVLSEEAQHSQSKYRYEFDRRNERLRELKRERRVKDKIKLDKDLEMMIVNLPRASQACRMEQLMTTKCLAEMPQHYKIRSYFENNDGAKRRLEQILRK